MSTNISTRRFDLHQTSSGRGLDYRPEYYFPASDFKTTINNPLPPELAKQDEIIKPFQTTTGEAHNYKYHGGLLSNNQHQKAPGHWNIHYNKDLREKLQQRGWRKPLTMGHQESEAQSQYKGDQMQLGVDFDNRLSGNPQPTTLQTHHLNSPAPVRDSVPKFKPTLVRDDGVLQNLDIYVPTSHRVHKRFTRHELDDYPKKDAATYWRCEDYTQAWGHGTKHNPLPKAAEVHKRPPMTDEMVFKTPIQEPVRWPERFQRVPHSGMKSTATSSYQQPSDPKMTELFSCPVDTPWVIPKAGPAQTFSVPNMYTTEYKTYASGKPINV
ncbi:stabilizer of axonemal microtubules 3-like [Diadema antillarum]|uniref:stabilizer of axonemal microtubules 3-like n=1 Tax=Diadema antillarum TaxID=105358 RepID=UPI003A8BD5F0